MQLLCKIQRISTNCFAILTLTVSNFDQGENQKLTSGLLISGTHTVHACGVPPVSARGVGEEEKQEVMFFEKIL